MNQINENINFEDQIKKLENIKRKIENQKELDEKLHSFIKSRLSENLSMLKNNFPKLFDIFEKYQVSDKYKIFCDENGEPNIYVKADKKAIYDSSPYKQCKEQVDIFLNNGFANAPLKIENETDPFGQIHFKYKNSLANKVKQIADHSIKKNLTFYESIPCIVMFGIGLGYQIGYLYERITPVNIYIVEPDLDLFYLSLCIFDYSNWINYVKQEKLGVKFYLSDDANLFLRDIGEYFSKYPVTFANRQFFIHYRTKEINNLLEILNRDASSLTLHNGFFDDYLFGMAHGLTNIFNHNKFWIYNEKLPDEYRNFPVVLVGNGPSLDDVLPCLKKYQDKVLIIACGTAYSALCKYNIKADIYIAVERIKAVYDSLLDIKENTQFFDDTLCIAPDVIHPKTLTLFKRKVLGFKINEILPRWLTAIKVIPSISKYTLFNRINPLVSNMGLKVAALLLFKNIYLIGIDNGTADNSNSHSRYSMYYDDDKKLKEKYENMTLNNNKETYPGNFGNSIHTNSLFKLSIQIMNECVSEFKNKINFYNCSNGAKIEGANPVHFDEIDWEHKPNISKFLVTNFIEQQMSECINVDPEYLKKHLYVEKFNEIVDTIISRINKRETSRINFILMEEDIYAYIDDYVTHGFSVVGCLKGTLTHLFAFINIVVYSNENENESLKKGYDCMDDIVSFLEHSKKIYPHVFNYIQGEHFAYQ